MRIKLIGIAVRKRPKAPMYTLPEADIKEGHGLVGNYRSSSAKNDKRLVTLLAWQTWDYICEHIMGDNRIWTMRRANILLDDCMFSQEWIGKQIQFGQQAILGVTGETSPCSRMDDEWPGLQKALEAGTFHGGLTCTVIRGGHIQLCDEVTYID